MPARPVKGMEATVASTLRAPQVEGATRPTTTVRDVPPDGPQDRASLQMQGIGPEHLATVLRAVVDLLARRAHGVGPTREDRRFRIPSHRPSGVPTPVTDTAPGVDHLVYPATATLAEQLAPTARITSIRAILAVAAPEDAVATPVRGETAHLLPCVLARPPP